MQLPWSRRDQELTYIELDKRSNQLANYLPAKERGVGPNSLVAVSFGALSRYAGRSVGRA